MILLFAFDSPVVKDETEAFVIDNALEVDVLKDETADVLDDISDANPLDKDATLVLVVLLRAMILLFAFVSPLLKDVIPEEADVLKDVIAIEVVALKDITAEFVIEKAVEVDELKVVIAVAVDVLKDETLEFVINNAVEVDVLKDKTEDVLNDISVANPVDKDATLALVLLLRVMILLFAFDNPVVKDVIPEEADVLKDVIAVEVDVLKDETDAFVIDNALEVDVLKVAFAVAVDVLKDETEAFVIDNAVAVDVLKDETDAFVIDNAVEVDVLKDETADVLDVISPAKPVDKDDKLVLVVLLRAMILLFAFNSPVLKDEIPEEADVLKDVIALEVVALKDKTADVLEDISDANPVDKDVIPEEADVLKDVIAVDVDVLKDETEAFVIDNAVEVDVLKDDTTLAVDVLKDETEAFVIDNAVEVDVLKDETEAFVIDNALEVDVLKDETSDVLDDISPANPVDKDATLALVLLLRVIILLFAFDNPVVKDIMPEEVDVLKDVTAEFVIDNALEVDVLKDVCELDTAINVLDNDVTACDKVFKFWVVVDNPVVKDPILAAVIVLKDVTAEFVSDNALEVDELKDKTADVLEDISDAKPVDKDATLVLVVLLRFDKALLVFDKLVVNEVIPEEADDERVMILVFAFDTIVLKEVMPEEVDVLKLFIATLCDSKANNSAASIMLMKA
jgi:hypothetical protein